MEPKPLEVLTGKALLALDVDPPKFIISRFLPAGLHLCFVPLTRDKRLSAKEILGNKTTMSRWQDDFHAHMSARWPMLERGERAADTQREHKTVQEYKRVTNLSPEYMRLWERYSRLKRLWERVPYPVQQRILEQERTRRERTRSR